MRKRGHSSLQAISPSAIRQTLARWLAGLDAVSRALFAEQAQSHKPHASGQQQIRR